jgi:hypothetical protein
MPREPASPVKKGADKSTSAIFGELQWNMTSGF